MFCEIGKGVPCEDEDVRCRDCRWDSDNVQKKGRPMNFCEAYAIANEGDKLVYKCDGNATAHWRVTKHKNCRRLRWDGDGTSPYQSSLCDSGWSVEDSTVEVSCEGKTKKIPKDVAKKWHLI